MVDLPSGTDDKKSVEELIPESFQIPLELIEKWSELPADFRFVPELPRVSWDALYSAIDQVNFALVALSRLAANPSATGDTVQNTLTEMGTHSIKAQNALRHFQAMLMSEALKAQPNGQ